MILFCTNNPFNNMIDNISIIQNISYVVASILNDDAWPTAMWYWQFCVWRRWPGNTYSLFACLWMTMCDEQRCDVDRPGNAEGDERVPGHSALHVPECRLRRRQLWGQGPAAHGQLPHLHSFYPTVSHGEEKKKKKASLTPIFIVFTPFICFTWGRERKKRVLPPSS